MCSCPPNIDKLNSILNIDKNINNLISSEKIYTTLVIALDQFEKWERCCSTQIYYEYTNYDGTIVMDINELSKTEWNGLQYNSIFKGEERLKLYGDLHNRNSFSLIILTGIMFRKRKLDSLYFTNLNESTLNAFLSALVIYKRFSFQFIHLTTLSEIEKSDVFFEKKKHEETNTWNRLLNNTDAKFKVGANVKVIFDNMLSVKNLSQYEKISMYLKYTLNFIYRDDDLKKIINKVNNDGYIDNNFTIDNINEGYFNDIKDMSINYENNDIVYNPCEKISSINNDIVYNPCEKISSMNNDIVYNPCEKISSMNNEQENENKDIILICKDCKINFPFTSGKQDFYITKGFKNPIRCSECVKNNKKNYLKKNKKNKKIIKKIK
jgi:hypothetical protein